MDQTDLASQLGIGRSTFYKLKKLGMPTDSVEAAKEWRRRNLDVMQTKEWRIDGNKGVKHEQSDNTDRALIFALTDVVPKMWFELSVGSLAGILRDNGVKITPEQLLKVQSCLYLVYMESVVEYLEGPDDLQFHIGSILGIQPDDEDYPAIVERLNNVLEKNTSSDAL